MRRFGLGLSLLALVSLLGAATATAAPSSPFEGSWTSTDAGDGSTQHLTIFGGTNVQMLYVDEFGSTCVAHEAPTAVFTGRLTGHVSGTELLARFKQGGCGPVKIIDSSLRYDWTLLYDEGTDTLIGPVDDGSTTWSRD